MITAKKSKKKPLTDKNALVKELKEVEWIKNPFIYSQIRGDFSLMQTQIMLAIVSNLQEQINEHINSKEKPTQLILPFVDTTEAKEGELLFKIRLADLGVRKDKYSELEEACDKLLKMDVCYTKVEDNGREYTVMANIFSRIEIPKISKKSDNTEMQYKSKERREGTVNIFMLKNNVSDVFDMRKGYVEHVKRIVPLCKKKRTPRLYIYLSRWKDVGHKCVDYNELKEFLGVLTMDAKRQNVKEDQYPMYYNFATKVLDPVKKEMDALTTMNEIDFTFEYRPKYNNGKRRGNPDGIIFDIILSQIGQQKKEKAANDKNLSEAQQLLKEEYGLTDNDVFGLYAELSPEMVPNVNEEVYRLRERLQTVQMRNPKLYVIQSMRNYIENIRPVVEEITEVTEEEAANEQVSLTPADQELWDSFMRLVETTIDKRSIDTFWSVTDIYSIQEDVVTLLVPNKFVAETIDEMIYMKLRVCFYSVFGEGAKIAYKYSDK